MKQTADISWLSKAIDDFIAFSPLNRVGDLKIFEPPLIGVAAADDPLFEALKSSQAIGPGHRTPREWLPGARTVISYFLRFSEPIRRANRVPGLPAAEWLHGRYEGEMFNEALRKHLVETLTDAGFAAISPALEPGFAVVDRRSNWSERHAAFIAGLGTFGLSRSLITVKGCAGRYGSVITTAALPATPRLYDRFSEFCAQCRACASRCPSGAIQPDGKRIAVCAEYLDGEIKPRFVPRYGCGKCQTGVPCEAGMPGI